MNQKFKILFLSFIISLLFSNNVYSLNDPCGNLMKAVIESDLKGFDLDYYDVSEPQVKIDKTYNVLTEQWEWKRDKDKNLIIGKIFDYAVLDAGYPIATNYLAEWTADKINVQDKNLYIDEFIKLKYWQIPKRMKNDLDEKNFSGESYQKEIIKQLNIAQKIINDEQLNIGDKIIKINGSEVAKLDDASLDSLIEDYNNRDYSDPENIGEEIEFEFLKKITNADGIKEDKKIIKKLRRIKLNQVDAMVNVEIKNLEKIDSKESSFLADLKIKTVWDIGYLYPLFAQYLMEENPDGEGFLHYYCAFDEEEWEDMGVGTFYTENVNGIEEDKTLVDEQYQVTTSDVIDDKLPEDEKYLHVEFIKNGKFKFKNNYDLSAFPFDRQTLKIQIAELSPGGTLEQVQLDFDNITYYRLSKFEKEGDILEWKILNTEAVNFNYIDPTNLVVHSGVELIIDVEREYQYYLYKVIFPIILILMVCWSVFWIHPREIESRLTITIVCLLSLIAYNFVIDEDLPKLGYLTIIDYIILLSYVFATLPNFLIIWAFQLQNSGDQVKWVKVDQLSRILGPVLYLFVVFAIIMSQVIGNENAAALFGALRNI